MDYTATSLNKLNNLKHFDGLKYQFSFSRYLKTHDEKSRRLWFLWTNDKTSNSTGKCGCIGGCVFFGKNKNGKRFFKPNNQDAVDGVNIAAFR